MANRTATYPIKATSRSVGRKKARRLSWFVVGAAFGLGCAWLQMPPDAVAPPVEVAAAVPVTPAAPPPTLEAMPAAVTVVAEAAALLSAPQEAEPVTLILPEAAQKEPAPAPAPTAKAEAVATPYPLNLELKAGNGDTLIGMLTDAGIAQDEAHNALYAAKKYYDPKKMTAGQSMSVELDKPAGSQNPIIASMTLPVSITESVKITRGKNDKFQVKKIEKPLTRMVAQANGTISSSLYQTGVDIGIPPAMIGEIINAYSYDIDFQRDIQPGHSIHALYERLQTDDGQMAGTGDLIFAELTMKNRSLKVYRYTDRNGVADYYNENGEGIRKALLRTPINGARISSGFGMRNHPILGYSRMHRGVDFAAPTGTPIYAAGDGVVKVAGRKGGYGNYLQVRHSGQYSTAYAHISRFASGIKAGKKVKQGQIVAYVGTTGASTGPHLHYEVLSNGKQINPSGLKFKTGNVLKGKELAQFRQTIEKIEAKIAAMPKNTKIAMVDFERDLIH